MKGVIGNTSFPLIKKNGGSFLCSVLLTYDWLVMRELVLLDIKWRSYGRIKEGTRNSTETESFQQFIIMTNT